MATLLSDTPANRAERRAAMTHDDRKDQFFGDVVDHIERYYPRFHELSDAIAQPLGAFVRAMIYGDTASAETAADILWTVSPTSYRIAKSEFDATYRLKRGAMRGIGLPGTSLPMHWSQRHRH